MQTEIQPPYPPFWGNSDLLVFNEDQKEIRALYSFIPLFRDKTSLVCLDPHEPTTTLFEIQLPDELSPLAERFNETMDICAIAVASATDGSAIDIETGKTTILREVQRALELPPNRGELIPLRRFPLLNSEQENCIENLMTWRDRLGLDEDTPDTSVATYLFIHQSSPK